MAYFPLFVELQGRRALIVGGGRLALHKAEKLLPYGAELRAVAPEFCPELQALPGVELRRGAFEPRDLDGVFLAIAATDRPGRQQRRRLSLPGARHTCERRGRAV
ncbi:MAG: bifunctional precorrin-2 dehydrogenase/sirohydrochlorin ferrochelatase [Lachnospiraceae bacterium]